MPAGQPPTPALSYCNWSAWEQATADSLTGTAPAKGKFLPPNPGPGMLAVRNAVKPLVRGLAAEAGGARLNEPNSHRYAAHESTGSADPAFRGEAVAKGASQSNTSQNPAPLSLAALAGACRAPGVAVVGLSGGADSLALVAGLRALGCPVIALVVDHGLQEGSAAVARRAADEAARMGAVAAVIRVAVDACDGVEAGARAARLAAFAAATDRVILAHSAQDAAENLLLTALRGHVEPLQPSRQWRSAGGTVTLIRPLLGLTREVLRAAAEEAGCRPWEDPMNSDRAFTRVFIREEILPSLATHVGGAVVAPLAESARLLAEDARWLDQQAAEKWQELGPIRAEGATTGWQVTALGELPEPIRRRLIIKALNELGARPTHEVVAGVDALITSWRGQGPVAITTNPATTNPAAAGAGGTGLISADQSAAGRRGSAAGAILGIARKAGTICTVEQPSPTRRRVMPSHGN